jgi:hypothetical protein
MQGWRAGEDVEILHRCAQAANLAGLAAGEDDVFELMGAGAPYDARGPFTPDVAMLEIAARRSDSPARRGAGHSSTKA